MNARAHLHGQISNQMSAQTSTQISASSQQIGNLMVHQMQNLGPRPVDSELQNGRAAMRRNIFNILQKRNQSSPEWSPRIPELVMRIEDRIFKDIAAREVYLSLVMEASEQCLYPIVKRVLNNILSSHHNASLSSVSMIPTPGMSSSGSNNSGLSVKSDHPTFSTSNTNVVPQTISSTVSLPSTAHGPTDNGNNTSSNASDGTISNGYQFQSSNFALASGSIMSSIPSTNAPRQFSQMIPTPGFNSQRTVSANFECSNGGLSSTEFNMSPQSLQLKKYVESQNIHTLHNLGSQIGAGMRSNILQNGSPCGLSNGLANDALGFIGNNIQQSAPAASEGFQSPIPYSSSSKPLYQNLDQQHHQSRMPTSMSRQGLPVLSSSYTVNTNNISHSQTFHERDSSSLSSISNINSAMDQSRTNQGLLNHHAGFHAVQLPLDDKPQLLVDQSVKMNYQSTHSIGENLLQSQQDVQQSNQTCAQIVQSQHQLLQKHQQSMQNQHQLIPKNDPLRQSSLASHFGEQLISNVTCSNTFFPSATQQVHPPDLQTQYQQHYSAEVQDKSVQVLGPLLNSKDFSVSISKDSQQLLHSHQQLNGFSNNFSCVSSGSQVEELLQFQCHPQPIQQPKATDKLSFQQIQEELHQRLSGQNKAQQPLCSARELDTANREYMKQPNYLKQQRWLLFLHHARRCPSKKGMCKEANCVKAQELIMHMDTCSSDLCKFPRCFPSRKLVKHICKCAAGDCPVCIPVRDRIAQNYKVHSHALAEICLLSEIKRDADGMKAEIAPSEVSQNNQPVSKRIKIEHISPIFPTTESTLIPVTPGNQHYDFWEVQDSECKQKIFANSDLNVKMDEPFGSGQEKLPVFDSTIKESVILTGCEKNPNVSRTVGSCVHQEGTADDKLLNHAAAEINQDLANQPTDQVTGKSGKPKIQGVSLIELFTPKQIKEHIIGLRQWVGQSKAKAEKNQAMERSMTENSCQLCAVEKLNFEPPPIYCSPCGARIKKNAQYYTVGSGDARQYFCIPCYNDARGDTIEAEGSVFAKSKLEKKRNDEETEEWWVQCDKCETWQHQICALFNGRRNDGEAEYTCPNCYVEEIERGERKPLPQSAVLGAKDLPRTILSDHIEQRLFKRLKHERQERAKQQGKFFDEVPGVEKLVVRVVSSVDKKLEVKQRFLEMFQEENYPREFPYKSKAILLFQKIEGVEVCLFGMYVQEFGSDSPFPNQRRVYLSYLDSVKYFRPEIKTVSGEALRTFVYHEILIGYLEYCKKRGFTSCYIWACPPLKGEDYILYCHPEIQKTPKSDKLREWYLSMLRKAAKENIVVDLTNLYDHFFVTTGECKAKVTAARLPYFDGDYCPGAAEDIINQLRQDEDGRKQMKKGKNKMTLTKRALKAAGHTDLSGNTSKDALLMQKLGETISPMKEDFIMVHLQHSCTHCRILMVSGTRWVCNQCKNFQLCDKCYEVEGKVDQRERHPTNSREKHMLYPVEIRDVAEDTKDKDDILESEFFDTRQAFLSLCQGNHYQYDTLRRAKHSSMMILYHLHNPTAPAFVTTCHVCYHDIETGQGWRCEICPDFDVCNACYQKGGIDHPHKLTNHPTNAERDAQNKEARAKRVSQLRKMLDLLVHASQCRSPQCQYPNCRKVKGLFRHGLQCKTRASGGCVLCKRMWYLLQLHARACKESACTVPRCRDLREHFRRLQQQSDSRRRAAVMEMMRQRAAEVAANSG
ncbi:probable histone acetyltransferase HAC-like 1 isoform X1 [Zingiber officinale]|uniref:probable histone acetyltransferase HAC-like 1 isoform X1 n=1 Tax=Zingiber officinale TaxID=94328 RepID=UPI001C4B7477|nr:probable histone acetyltransferase HAC-like 1 isoform X1 [Zingiber officinale]XP_042375025.1 probable histone acetyltransferase HAC-like 1 isoform X1 [Zingiber officinale]